MINNPGSFSDFIAKEREKESKRQKWFMPNTFRSLLGTLWLFSWVYIFVVLALDFLIDYFTPVPDWLIITEFFVLVFSAVFMIFSYIKQTSELRKLKLKERGEKMKWPVIITIGVLLLLGWFWWSQLRPTSIKKQCAKDNTEYFGTVFSNRYDKCLRTNGL